MPRCLADLSKHIGSLQEEIDSLRADKNELVKQQAQQAVAERHGYIAASPASDPKQRMS